jgi:hypothetical protein
LGQHRSLLRQRYCTAYDGIPEEHIKYIISIKYENKNATGIPLPQLNDTALYFYSEAYIIPLSFSKNILEGNL